MLVLYPLRKTAGAEIGELIPESAFWPNQRAKIVSNVYGCVPLSICPKDVQDAVAAIAAAQPVEESEATAPKRKKLSKEPMTAADLTIEEAVAVSPQASDDPFTV